MNPSHGPEANELCKHGEYLGDCPDCIGVCPHGFLSAICGDCNWVPSDYAIAALILNDISQDDDLLDRIDKALAARQPNASVYADTDRRVRQAKADAKRERDYRIAKTLVVSLTRHGLPLHYSVLARIAHDVDQDINEPDVIRVLRRAGNLFVRVQPGVYFIRT